MINLKTTLSAFALAAAVAATSAIGALAQGKPTVGIAMPTKSSARWIDDGNNIVKVLKERGYNTDLQYAEDDIPNQLSQVENMVTKGAKALVSAAIDGTTLSDVLKQAKAKGITSIAYDRLIRGTPNIDSGKLVVVSGQMGMDKVATLRWDGATPQARMDNLLSAYYGNKKVSALLSPYDGLSIGIISSLKGVGYGSADQPMPIISGKDAEVPSIKAMLRGDQYSTS